MQHLNLHPEADIRVSRNVTDGYDMPQMHLHEQYEIYLAMTDGNKYFINNRIYDVNRHDLFIFDNTDLHRTAILSPEPYDRYVLTFSPDPMERLFGASILACFDKTSPHYTHKLSLSDEDAPTVLSLLDPMCTLSRTDSYAKDLRLKLRLAELLLFITHEQSQLKHTALQAGQKGIPDGKPSQILHYLNEHFRDPITLDQIAAHFYLNKFHLCRLFKRATGFSPVEYILYRRLACAAALLQAGTPVTATAELSGFTSDTYFITAFKKHIGITPKQYAKQFGASG